MGVTRDIRQSMILWFMTGHPQDLCYVVFSESLGSISIPFSVLSMPIQRTERSMLTYGLRVAASLARYCRRILTSCIGRAKGSSRVTICCLLCTGGANLRNFVVFLIFKEKEILTKCCAERPVNWLQTVIIVKEFCFCLWLLQRWKVKTKMIFTT